MKNTKVKGTRQLCKLEMKRTDHLLENSAKSVKFSNTSLRLGTRYQWGLVELSLGEADKF